MKRFDYRNTTDYSELQKYLDIRKDNNSADVEGIVKDIIDKVRAEGDDALRFYNAKFDGCTVQDLKVSEEEIEEAFKNIDKELLGSIEKAAANITYFHQKQLENSWFEQKEDGTTLGMMIQPLRNVGIYVPGGAGGKTPLPSSVLMNAVPAQVAGVKQIVMVTPPAADGTIPGVTLVAAKIAGVTEIYKVGGAQSIAALAYGTETIPAVDKITGPGNAFVATAKKMVFGQCGIDMVAGPSEICVVTDSSSDPTWLAADLLSQAEHDKLAASYLVTTDEALAEATISEVEKALKPMERYEIAKASWDDYGAVILCKDMDQCFDIANIIAPEHLEIAVDNPLAYIYKPKTAGALFLGHYTPEALGDYMAGPNHILPTIGTGRFSSPLNTIDFMKKTTILCYNKEAFMGVQDDVVRFANSEGLTGHARSAAIRK
ncbi:MAG: histidinol dehydrogenase [Firmicutes bacterium]|nr:histidinol dehydrogenase [Bacillota bacterium]MBQ4093385.1 histidinol dehydrogenase [Bacillota bacterium]